MFHADAEGSSIPLRSASEPDRAALIAAYYVLFARGRVSTDNAYVKADKALVAAEVEGRVWDWVVPVEQLADVRQRFRISSTLRRGDGIQVRVIADASPHPSAVGRAAALEDAYLHAKARAAAPA